MNEVGFDACCFGNHEADVPFDSLLKRINEMEATWLNSNMEKLNADPRVEKPPPPRQGTAHRLL
jgi:2',3'-cyclic-nucleotide 2'-phosphodiesterase (5'-nucleotidase family)